MDQLNGGTVLEVTEGNCQNLVGWKVRLMEPERPASGENPQSPLAVETHDEVGANGIQEDLSKADNQGIQSKPKLNEKKESGIKNQKTEEDESNNSQKLESQPKIEKKTTKTQAQKQVQIKLDANPLTDNNTLVVEEKNHVDIGGQAETIDLNSTQWDQAELTIQPQEPGEEGEVVSGALDEKQSEPVHELVSILTESAKAEGDDHTSLESSQGNEEPVSMELQTVDPEETQAANPMDVPPNPSVKGEEVLTSPLDPGVEAVDEVTSPPCPDLALSPSPKGQGQASQEIPVNKKKVLKKKRSETKSPHGGEPKAPSAPLAPKAPEIEPDTLDDVTAPKAEEVENGPSQPDDMNNSEDLTKKYVSENKELKESIDETESSGRSSTLAPAKVDLVSRDAEVEGISNPDAFFAPKEDPDQSQISATDLEIGATNGSSLQGSADGEFSFVSRDEDLSHLDPEDNYEDLEANQKRAIASQSSPESVALLLASFKPTRRHEQLVSSSFITFQEVTSPNRNRNIHKLLIPAHSKAYFSSHY